MKETRWDSYTPDIARLADHPRSSKYLHIYGCMYENISSLFYAYAYVQYIQLYMHSN